MAVPKRRKSRARTHSRRSQWKAEVPTLTPLVVDGRVHLVPPRLLPYYRRYPEKLD
ncbi:MAG: 50S ribosomal protein L32 [Nakamurella sp.]